MSDQTTHVPNAVSFLKFNQRRMESLLKYIEEYKAILFYFLVQK